MSSPTFAHIGLDHVVQTNRVMAIIPPNLKTGRRYLEIAKNRGMHIDASRGRLYRSLLILDDGTVITSAISVQTLMKRFMTSPADLARGEYAYDDAEDMIDFNEEESSIENH